MKIWQLLTLAALLLLNSCAQSIAVRLVSVPTIEKHETQNPLNTGHLKSFYYKGVKIDIDTGYYYTNPPMFEVFVSLETDSSCHNCSLDKIEVTDTGRNIAFQLLPINVVANILYPPQSYATYQTVPKPDIVGVEGISRTTGYYTNSLLVANSDVTTKPIYDYEARDKAIWQNFGTSIYNNEVSNANNARAHIVQYTGGDITFGHLPNDAKRRGSLFFAVPPYAVGPYQVKVFLNKTGFVKGKFWFQVGY